MSGSTLPNWLLGPGKVLYKRQVRHTKEDPLVDEVDLLDANTQYAHIRFPGGRESTVSTKHLAPAAECLEAHVEEPSQPPEPSYVQENADARQVESAPTPVEQRPPLRRSARESKPPVRLNYENF